jgi:CO/xanthine dehydrogenase Mo-binding subunit
VRRWEDGRLLVGRGRYVTDLPFESALHVAIVRSPHAHARIVGVDARPARGLAGVRGVFVLGDLPELRGALPAPAVPAAPVKPYRQSPLADGVAHFAGEAVAVVVANDPYRASDAAEAGLAGDTARFPASSGTYASRVAVVVGNAVAAAAGAVGERVRWTTRCRAQTAFRPSTW